MNLDSLSEEELQRFKEQERIAAIEAEMDEIDILIRNEEEEFSRQQKEIAEKAEKDAKFAKEKKIKDDANAVKLEKIRQQERDLLD